MARKPVARLLPPLPEACADFRGFAPAENRQNTIVKLLRRVADKARQRQPRPFFSVRNVADFFGVSTGTVAKVYRQMEQEGTLIRQRSSQTLISPSIMRPRTPLRAVVALPIWRPGFVSFPHWRFFFDRLDEQLRSRGFAADFIFFGSVESADVALAKRVLAHQPDLVFWHAAVPQQKQTIDIITDAGVRVAASGNRHSTGAAWRYILRVDRALRECIAGWKQDGIRVVSLPVIKGRPLSAAHGELPQALAAAGVRFQLVEFSEFGGFQAGDYVRSLWRDADAVFFDNDVLFQALCHRVPEEMIELFGNTRAAIMEMMDILDFPTGRLAGARVDVFHHDYAHLARRIVEDLSSGAAFLQKPLIVEGKWAPKADAMLFTCGY